MLKVYLRVLAGLYLCGAVLHAADLLDLRLEFSSMTVIWKTWVIYLFVADLVASVGLWRQRPWGILLFIVIAVSQLVAYLGFPEIFGDAQQALVVFHGMTLTLYAGILFVASQNKRAERLRHSQES